MMRGVLIASAACCTTLGGSPARADHIPGHENDDPTFPVPLPGPDFWNGDGAIMGLFIGPREGTEITGTTIDITWVQEGQWPASDLFIEVGVQVNNDTVHFELSGADLGFGDEPGTYHGELSTDMFNGIVWEYPGWPHSLIDLGIGGTHGAYEGPGHFEDSWIVFDVIPVPAPQAASVLGLASLLLRQRRAGHAGPPPRRAAAPA